jgi:uncharacterized protein YcfL
MKTVMVTLLAAALICAGCSSAKKANEVSAAYVPIHRYSTMTCQQLVSEAEGLRRSTPALEAAVDSHRSQQTGVEVVTWILFWPAAFALDKGEKQSNELAQARGELQAIQQALLSNNCNRATDNGNSAVTYTSAIPAGSKNVETKLATLKDLYAKNLLTEEQYNEQVKATLNDR